MKKILFGITSLTIGGAERVLVDLANQLSSEYDITILTLYANGELEKQLNKNIKLKSIYNKSFKSYSKIKRIAISFRLVFSCIIPKGYDTYVSFLEGPITRQIAKIKSENKIAWVHNDISKVFGNGVKAKIKKATDKRSYNKYNKIIFVSEENRNDFIKTYGNKFETLIIKNYLDYKNIIKKSSENFDNIFDSKNTNLLTVARLVDQKGIDRFIRIHKRILEDGIKHNVYIIGDGPLMSKLKDYIKKYNVEDSFLLLGKKQNPYPYIKNTDYFCLLSNYEGYGMVIDEAKILNKQIIITKTAAIEALENYENCYVLENDENSIYEGLKNILKVNNINNNMKNNFDYSSYYSKILEQVKNIL